MRCELFVAAKAVVFWGLFVFFLLFADFGESLG